MNHSDSELPRGTPPHTDNTAAEQVPVDAFLTALGDSEQTTPAHLAASVRAIPASNPRAPLPFAWLLDQPWKPAAAALAPLALGLYLGLSSGLDGAAEEALQTPSLDSFSLLYPSENNYLLGDIEE